MSRFTEEHIKNQFISNPYWKEVFISKFPNWTPSDWTENAWSIFEENGYTYKLERCSERPESKWYNAVKDITLYGPFNEEIIGMRHLTTGSALEQLLLSVILLLLSLLLVLLFFEVDFTTFK